MALSPANPGSASKTDRTLGLAPQALCLRLLRRLICYGSPIVKRVTSVSASKCRWLFTCVPAMS